MKRFARLTALFAGVVLAAAAHGQAGQGGPAGSTGGSGQADRTGQADANQPPPPPLYQVEVVVFANSGVDPNEETFPLITPPAATVPAAPAGEAPQPPLGTEPQPAPATEPQPASGTEPQPASGTAPQPGTVLQPGTGPGAGDASADVFEEAQSVALPDEAAEIGPDAETAGGAGAGGATAGAGGETAAAEGTDTTTAAGTDAAAGANSTAGAEATGGTAAAPEPLIGPSGFRIVDASTLKLADAYARLQRLDAYRPLLHAAWIQPALAEDQAPAIEMTDLGTLNPVGTIRFYTSRYLHVNVDLTYRPTAEQAAALEAAEARRAAQPPAGTAGGPVESAPAAAGAPAGATEDAPVFAGVSGGETEPLEEISLGPRLRMKTSRRISAGDVQYFDHPYFGLIVLVTPYEPPAAPGGAATAVPAP